MKKVILATVFCLSVFANFVNAQFKLGLEPALGMNFNIHSGSDLPENGTGVGIIVGGYAHMMFSKNIGMIAGLSFYDNRRGSHSTTEAYQGVNVSSDISASIAYFQIESLFKLLIPGGVYFVMGPVLGFNIESEAEVKLSAPGYQSSTTKSSIKDTPVRFEIKAGSGYEIPLSASVSIIPQITFGYGLTNVVKDVKWKIMTFQAICGVKFDLL